MTARLAILTLLAVSLGACKRTAPAGAAFGGGGGRPDSEPFVVRFSDPGNAGIFAYAKREGILERELAKVHATIAWIPAAGAFNANVEAMNSGAMNASGGASAVAGEELRLATEETRVVPAFRVPTAADKRRIHNVADIFFTNKSIDRQISVDDIVFDVGGVGRVNETAKL